jgi:hypothetical protein
MADVLFVSLLVALFAVTVGFVQVCDRMVGSGEDVAPGSVLDETERVAA